MRSFAISVCGLTCAVVLAARVPAAAQAPTAAPAQEAASEAGAAETPAPKEPAADSSPETPEASVPPEPETQTMHVITAEETNAQQKLRVTRALAQLNAEREHTSRFGPWLLTSLGIASVVVGISVGIGHTFGCKGACRGPFWPGWLVVGGGTIATAGAIWITWTNHDIAELERRKSSLELELQGLEWNRAGARLGSQAQPRAALAWGGRF
jgi:hypothetical protein